MDSDTADKRARVIAKGAQAGIHEVLVSLVRSETPPDLGYLLLERIAKDLSQATVYPAYEVMKELEGDN